MKAREKVSLESGFLNSNASKGTGWALQCFSCFLFYTITGYKTTNLFEKWVFTQKPWSLRLKSFFPCPALPGRIAVLLFSWEGQPASLRPTGRRAALQSPRHVCVSSRLTGRWLVIVGCILNSRCSLKRTCRSLMESVCSYFTLYAKKKTAYLTAYLECKMFANAVLCSINLFIVDFVSKMLLFFPETRQS